MSASAKNRSKPNALSRLFSSPRHEAQGAPIFTVASLGGKWWIFHRSDGRSGGIFDSKDGALLQARLDAKSVQIAIIEIVQADELESKDVYIKGTLAGAAGDPILTIVRQRPDY